MKLSTEGKKKLIDSANQVYLAYTALDFFKGKKFSVAGRDLSLQELCKKAIAENQLDQNLIIDGVNYRLVLVPSSNNTYKVQLTRPVNAVGRPPVKKLSGYSNTEALTLLASQEFSLEVPEPNAEPIVSNKINEQYVIGGAGKVDLYRTHLVTLHNIIEKISSEEDISSLLVALATGSGKTFVQALWVLALSLSGNNSVFAVPDRLASQFVKDLRRLLPDAFVDTISVLRENENNPQAEGLIKSLAKKETTGKILVASSERLLDKQYQELLDADSERTFLAFDEQHLIMKEERRRVRLIELSKQKLSMFLTATPNKETYELCGHKPVAIMSSGQKQEAGQGQFPELITHQARNISDRNKLKNYKFWMLDFWKNMLNGLLLRLTNSIQEEHSSAAVTLVEDLPFYVQEKEDEKNPRWRMQAPAARKMLCIIDDNETLVNFCNALQANDIRNALQANDNRRDVYHNGNVINRRDVADFFGIPDAEVDIIRHDMASKRRAYEKLLGAKGIKEYKHSPLEKRLQSNIFHNLVEYVLTDITGLDEIEHNCLRKQDKNAFVELVRKKYQQRSADYYQEKLTAVIDPDGAKIIGELLSDLFSIFNEIKDINLAEEFIDNWSLDDNLFQLCVSHNRLFDCKFRNYANSHLLIGVMAGMKDAETPVAESRPFAGLKPQTYSLYDSDGVLNSNVKKRKHTSLEILSNTSQETSFTPNYLGFSEEIADAYFRLGFTGMYVSNKKTEGFSDRNLHTVVNLAEHTLSSTNSPETQIQGIGRNRGLDDTIKPVYIHSLGRKQQTVFSLEHLKSNDYYPELFKSQKGYNKRFVKVLGEQVAQQVITWIHTNLDKDETIHPDRLKRQVLKYIAYALRDINNKNSHQIKLSRAELTKIVGHAMGSIDKEIARIKKPYHLSSFIEGLGVFLNVVCEIYYTPLRIYNGAKVYYHSWFGQRDPVQGHEGQRHPDDVYIKIIHKTSFKNIVTQLGSLREFQNWLKKKQDGIRTHLEKNVGDYFKKDAVEVYSTHQKHFIVPLLMKFVVDNKQAKVAEAIAAFPQFMSFLQTHLPALKELLENQSPDFEKEVLKILQQIPGLQDLTRADLVNYPKKMAGVQSVFNGGAKNLVAHSPELQAAFSSQLVAFLKNDMNQYLSAFISYPQVKELQKQLNTDNQAQAFVDHCVGKFMADELQLAPALILEELRRFFPMCRISTLTEDMSHLHTEFSALQAEMSEQFFEHMRPEAMGRIVLLIKNKLLPALVNLYPLESRERLLLAATDEKIAALLVEHGKVLLSVHEPAEVADFIFSKLQDRALPAHIDPAVEAEKVKQFFISEFSSLKIRAAGAGIAKSAWAFVTRGAVAEYSFVEPVSDLLKKDAFFDAISTLLPYTQWLDLKSKMQQDDAARLNIARHIVILGEGAINLSPEQLITLFNDELHTAYKPALEAAQIAGNSIKSRIAEMGASPLSHLSFAMQNKLLILGSEQLLPLLASFIKEDNKKEQFLAVQPPREIMSQFLVQQGSKLPEMLGANGEQLKANALTLINQLLPEGAKLVAADMVDPAAHAISSANAMSSAVKRTLLISFLNSVIFRDLMKDLLNHEDYQLVLTCMSSEQYISRVADNILAKEGVALDKETLFAAIKDSDPRLKDIDPLDKRLETFQRFIDDLGRSREKSLDKNKAAQLIANFMTPVLFNAQFISTVDQLIGFLDEKDLTVLFAGLEKANPAEEAKQLITFLKLVRAQNKEKLMRQFMISPEADQDFDFEKIPLKNTLDNLEDIIKEVLDSHCAYNNHDRRGESRGGERSKLYGRISSELQEMTIPDGQSFVSEFSRKFFYIQGIRKGLASAGQVNADSNQHVVKILQRVKTHILSPLWWSTNLSKVGHAFIKGCHEVAGAAIRSYYGVVNGIKSLSNWITGSSFTISTKNLDSQDYHETAHEFAERLNALEPLAAKQVQVAECPPDVVVHLESYVEARPSRVGFFGNLGVPDAVSKNMEDDREHSFPPPG